MIFFFEILKAVFLGIIEGVTEFLPISSTGHLILANQFVSSSAQFTVLFDIVIQLGAILAVAIFFIDRLWPFGNDKIKNKTVLNTWHKTIVAVLPALLLGALFSKFIKEILFTPWVVAGALIVGGIAILYIEKKQKSETVVSIGELSFKNAFLIGLIQCVALVPGVSRSAATIMGSMVLGASRTVATEFSFFLAIPTMVAASAYSLLKYRGALTGMEIVTLIVGFVVSFAVALGVIRFLIRYIQKHDFKMFGYYRIVLGVLVLGYFFFIKM